MEENMGTEQNEYLVKEQYPVSFGYAALTVLVVIGIVIAGMLLFGAPLELMFLLSWLAVVPLLMKLGYSYDALSKMAWKMATQSFEPNMILLALGAMIAVWIASGTIPFIIFLGLKLLSADHFLISVLLVCSFTSMATGTSWGTLGTMGLVFAGLGQVMGIPAAMTAGAVISGAYFGDKMSPISDSTILAASIAGTTVIRHVRHMMWTTVPSYIISALLFIFLDFQNSGTAADMEMAQEISRVLEEMFRFSGIEAVPILLVFVLLIKGAPSIMTMLLGVLSGSIVAVAANHVPLASLFTYMIDGYTVNCGNEFVDALLCRGGINSMVSSFLAIFLALTVSGMLDNTGLLQVLVTPLVKKCEGSTFRLIACTVVLTYVTNAIGSSMLFASIVTGTLLRPYYQKQGLAPENLSRTLEDSGTMGAVLIPWNANAIYASQMLGVGALSFIPYCFLNWITPCMALFYAKKGICLKVKKRAAD